MSDHAATMNRPIDHVTGNAEARRRDEQRIQKLASECGCRAGAIALFAAVAIFAIYQLLPNATMPRPHVGWLWGIPLVFAASITGKLSSIGAAKLQLHFIYRRRRAPSRPR